MTRLRIECIGMQKGVTSGIAISISHAALLILHWRDCTIYIHSKEFMVRGWRHLGHLKSYTVRSSRVGKAGHT